jgi:hypothetical protein
MILVEIGRIFCKNDENACSGLKMILAEIGRISAQTAPKTAFDSPFLSKSCFG